MISILEFTKNKVISKIAKEERWTVSTKDKMPIDAKHLLEKKRIRPASFEEGNPLVTLHELNEDPNLNWTNRAYRLNAANNNVIMIDVEPIASESAKQFFRSFPCHYMEVSMSGKGLHLLIEVPKDLIDEENEYIFKRLVVLKKKEKDIEILLNNHYVTFTRNTIPHIKANFENNELHKKILKNFLDSLVAYDLKNKKEREKANKLQSKIITGDIADIALANAMIYSLAEVPFEKTPEDYDNDLSRYDIATASFYSGRIFEVLKRLNKKMTISDIIYMVYKLTKKFLPHRDKYNTKRKNMPYLYYITKEAVSYIIDEEKEKYIEEPKDEDAKDES